MTVLRPRVLITGASGLLGWSLVREFADGYDLLTPDLDEFDLLRPHGPRDYLAAHKPNLVVHAAAYTAVDRAEEEPEAAMAVNARGTEELARAASACGSCLVYLSTDYVFDGAKGAPYREEDEPHPLGVYGRSKLEGERAVVRILQRSLIVRTAWIFGPGRPNFVAAMAARARAGERVRVVDDQIGSPTYTPHLARAIRRLYEARVQGVVHAANEGTCSWFDLTRETYRAVGADPDLVEPLSTADLGRPAPRPPYSALATARLASILGDPLPSWREAVRLYLSLPESAGGA